MGRLFEFLRYLIIKNSSISSQIPVPNPVDRLNQAQSNVHGSHSANNGNGNVFGNYTATTNIYGPCDMTSIGGGNGRNGFGEGDSAPSPYRLIPYSRNNKFTGRRDLLESVKRFSGREGHNRIALYGLGGSGKTQIALEYTHQRASQSDCNIFWVSGSGSLKFKEGFKAIAQRVQILPPGAKTDGEDFLLGVKGWFEGSNSGDWILVIDNADNDADFDANNSPIAKFIPQDTKGTVIFTTRSRQVASRQGCEMIQVGKMGREEAEELFSKRLGSWGNFSDEEKKAIAMILDSVHHLPLAVVGSAAFMIETETLPSVYWTIFQENEERMKKLLSQKFCDFQREADVTESILGTYFVTFERIRQQMPPAADLLRLMAFLDRQNIPEELLRQCGLEGMNDLVEFRLAIGNLLGFSMITSVKCGKGTFYELHRLVQLSLQVYLSAEDLHQWKGAALQLVSRFFPQDWNGWRRIGPEYISQALAVTKDSTDPIAEELCFRMGRYFLDMGSYNHAEIQFRRCIALRREGGEYEWDGEGYERFMFLGSVTLCQGKYDESEAMFRLVLEVWGEVLGPYHPGILGSVNDLALVLGDQGKYREAEKMHRRTLGVREKVLGPDHLDTLKSANNLGLVLGKQGKHDEAEKMDRHTLAVREKVLGPDHPDTLTSANNLAMMLDKQGKHDEAEKMDRHTLAVREKVLGPDHPNTLISVNNLAMALQNQGKHDEAERMHRRALEVREKVLGPDHPDTLNSANNLGLVLEKQGKHDEAEKMDRHTLAVCEKVLGPDHPNTLRSASNLAVVLAKQGKHDKAEKMDRHTLAVREKVLGPDHPDTLISVDNLAMALQNQGKHDEAEKMHRRALEVHEKVLGLAHPHTVASIYILVEVLEKQGKYSESEKIYWRVLEEYEKALGPDHPTTLTIVGCLAMALLSQGKSDEFVAMNRRSLEGWEKVLGPDHPEILKGFSSLAVFLEKQGKRGESEAMNRRVLQAYEKVLGPDHPDTLTSFNNLAVVLENQGKHDEAEKIDRHTLAAREKVLGPDHPGTLTSVNNLAIVLWNQGKHNESERMNRRALEGREKILGPEHPDTLISVSNLAVVLQRQGKYNESEKMYRRTLEAHEKFL